MSYTIGDTKDLDASRREAIQSLLGSLGHASGSSPSSAVKLSAEQVRKLSEKIKEILGDDENRGSERDDQPNQLLNEDDLPIVDITEPVNEDSQTGTPSAYISEAELIPWSLLPPDEKERRRRERDRVLDLLEEEERLLQLKEQRDAEEERKEAIRNRKESAKGELAHLKATRELQKKMGQALVRNSKGMGDDERDEDARSKPQPTASSVTKKCVSFADVPAMEDNERDQMSVRQPGWGDITPGRLRAQNRIPLVSTAEAQKYPMKMHVVERHPTTTATSLPHPDADSDDESPSAGNLSPHAGSDLLNEDDSSSSVDHLSDNEPLEEAFDYDTAQHHREIALEYHKKRHAIGAGTAKALAAHDLDDEQPESLQSIRQSPLSHFRADHMAAAHDKSHASGPVSTSVGQTVIPPSRQKSLRSSMRLGKLEGDRLVGAESGESGSEDEAVRQMIQMLRTGNIENVGPNFQSSIVSPPEESLLESTTVEMSGVTQGVKQSRFKLARGDRNTKRIQDDRSWDNVRSQPAISSVVERKAPKSSPSQRFPINKPPSRPPVSDSEPPPPMIIHSPSFPMISTVATASSPVTTSGVPSPNRTQAEYSSSGKPSAVPDSTAPSQASSHDSLSSEKPTSRFMAERKK